MYNVCNMYIMFAGKQIVTLLHMPKKATLMNRMPYTHSCTEIHIQRETEGLIFFFFICF